MENVVECKNLTHYYGEKLVYENMSFEIKKGSIFGLLGKNGTGKTTTINILNGFLKPVQGQCLIFGENSQSLKPETKARIGFLMEGHIQYNFMNIYQIEKFYSAYFPNWKKEPYYELMSKLDISEYQKIKTMSCGQRSQVALGLILAQDPDLMILDDYSMGLDAGYRRLFLDYLNEYAKGNFVLLGGDWNMSPADYKNVKYDKDVTLHGIYIARFKDKLITEGWQYFDNQQRYEQLGFKMDVP